MNRGNHRVTDGTARVAAGLYSRGWRQLGLAAVAGGMFAANAASAQDIVVAGTRISRPDQTSATPVVTATAEDLQLSVQVNIEATLAQLPMFGVGADAYNNPLGGGGYASVNLRGLGEQRNLVLLDGMRLPMASPRGVVDINAIPAIAIDEVEITTGGGSAIYGSDAISGVVNFRLRDRFDGLEVSGQTGISEHGDGAKSNIGAIYGTKFAGGRGHIMLAGSYTDRGVVTGSERCAFYCGGGAPSSYLATGQIMTPFSGANPAAVAALFNGKYGIAGPIPTLTNFGVNNNGSVFSSVGGANLDSQGGTYRILPVGISVNQMTGVDNYIVQPQQRATVTGAISFEATPAITVFVKGLFTDSRVQTDVGYSISASSPLNPVFQGGIYGGNMVLPASNPFISPDLAALLASRANPNAPIYYFKRFDDLGRRVYDETYQTWQVTGGLKGNLAAPGWHWQFYVDHGATDVREEQPTAVLLSRVQTLLNAPDGGNSICAGGYNPFGSDNTVSPACRAYLTTDAVSTQAMRQDVVEGSLNGQFGALPAGDARFALAATWRRDSYSALPDCHNRAVASADCAGIDPADIASTVAQYPVATVAQEVGELSGEVLVPLLRDAPFAKAVDLDLGGRWSRYSHYGNNWTWRGEATWQVVAPFMVRGGYERAVRVPSFAEAAIATTGNVASLTNPDPCSLTSPATRAVPQIAALCLSQMSAPAYASYIQTSPAINAPIQGNAALSPEQADTLTLGAVLRPGWHAPVVHRLSFSVDYYAIHIANAIGLYPLAQTALANCFNLDAAHSNPTYSPTNPFCQLIGRNGTGQINSIAQPYVNLGAIRTDGIDLTLQWEAELGGGAGFVGVDSRFTRLLTYSVQSVPGGPLQEWAGTLGAGLLFSPATSGSTAPQPRWRGLTSVHYRREGGELSLRWRFISGMSDPNAIPGFSPPGTPDYSLFDIAGTLVLPHGVSLRAGVDNVFNKQPPTITYPGMTLPSIYDVVGRSFWLGVTARM